MADNVPASKGCGKGKAPPPPKAGAALPKPSSMSAPLNIKVRMSATLKPTDTVVTGLDGKRTVHKQDGSTVVLSAPANLRAYRQERTAESIAAVHALAEKYTALVPFAALFEEGESSQTVQAKIRSRLTADQLALKLGFDLADAFDEAVKEAASGPEPALADQIEWTLAEKHGLLGLPEWASPQLKVRCGSVARPGYAATRAHEYLDNKEVLREKVGLLARLVRTSKKLCVYAGAGLSTSSGISDYATRTGGKGLLESSGTAAVAPCRTNSPFDAKPNAGHRTFAAMAHAGYLWRLVQQNHDGLPQKAGVPQQLMNEIHGAIFDPSNPVVTMKGSVRADLSKDLMEVERKVDLLMVVGTSLSGMSADRIVTTCADRARTKHLRGAGENSMGPVIISLQRTPADADASLRIFALIDDVMELLAAELGLEIPSTDVPAFSVPEEFQPEGRDADVYSVPYDDTGFLVEDKSRHRVLDLRKGAQLRVTCGPDAGAAAHVLGKNADGHWSVEIVYERVEGKFGPFNGMWQQRRMLGKWWINAAVRGEVEYIPLV